ncbi:MAG: hypothetical protein AAF236_15485 [Verrucomicrobiota bacterium]
MSRRYDLIYIAAFMSASFALCSVSCKTTASVCGTIPCPSCGEPVDVCVETEIINNRPLTLTPAPEATAAKN